MNRLVDSQDVLGSVHALPQQVLDAYEQTRTPALSRHEYDAVVISGMGGSGLAGRVIETVYADVLDVPLVRVHGYELPAFAGGIRSWCARAIAARPKRWSACMIRRAVAGAGSP